MFSGECQICVQWWVFCLFTCWLSVICLVVSIKNACFFVQNCCKFILIIISPIIRFSYDLILPYGENTAKIIGFSLHLRLTNSSVLRMLLLLILRLKMYYTFCHPNQPFRCGHIDYKTMENNNEQCTMDIG